MRYKKVCRELAEMRKKGFAKTFVSIENSDGCLEYVSDVIVSTNGSIIFLSSNKPTFTTTTLLRELINLNLYEYQEVQYPMLVESCDGCYVGLEVVNVRGKSVYIGGRDF